MDYEWYNYRTDNINHQEAMDGASIYPHDGPESSRTERLSLLRVGRHSVHQGRRNGPGEEHAHRSGGVYHERQRSLIADGT